MRRARAAAAELLRGATQLALPTAGAPRSRIPRSVAKRFYRMRTAVLNLGSPLNLKDERAGVDAHGCAFLAIQLETLALVGVLESSNGRLTAQTLSAAADALLESRDDTGTGDVGVADQPELVQLAGWVGRSSSDFVAACALLTELPSS